MKSRKYSLTVDVVVGNPSLDNENIEFALAHIQTSIIEALAKDFDGLKYPTFVTVTGHIDPLVADFHAISANPQREE